MATAMMKDAGVRRSRLYSPGRTVYSVLRMIAAEAVAQSPSAPKPPQLGIGKAMLTVIMRNFHRRLGPYYGSSSICGCHASPRLSGVDFQVPSYHHDTKPGKKRRALRGIEAWRRCESGVSRDGFGCRVRRGGGVGSNSNESSVSCT